MDVTPTALPGVLCLKPRRFSDNRGFFSETWSARRMAEAGLEIAFVQDNHSYSVEAGTLRGLHYQAPPMAQTKLVRVSKGSVLDVAVDIRAGSPTFGQWVGQELSAENGIQLLIPRGFLHGFITREPETEVLYKVDAFYDPATDGAVRYDSPEFGIDWGCDPAQIILSDKDAAAPSFADFTTPFEYDA
ncbi:MAG: dTDP-4-dehydrorhamnose 3,5-epimerase [Pseudomonadota bacterium]